MLSVSSNFTAAEKADVNQIASKIQLVLGNYASASAFGATASASGSDASGDYPASGAIDGDRTEINVGPASGADNDVGKSSWRSAVAPSATPQTLTIDFGQSRTINRIKLYHLSSHGLKSYKLESSPDNAIFTLIAKTTDQGGTISTTNQLDTIDFTDVACRYVKLTVSDTVVVSDKANVVEIECYRRVDVTSRVISGRVNRNRDYKIANPLAASFSLTFDNSDRFFSINYTPTAAEVTAGFVNSELKPNIGIIIQHGFAYGGKAPELATVLNGFVDRIQISPAERTATMEGRDAMKSLINQIVSSKLKTSQDVSACIQYGLNLCNISSWETALDSTGLTIDYFFINRQSVLTTVRDLVQASADAAFYFDESGIAKFRYYVNATPQQKTETSQADFVAGTIKTNIDTDSVPGTILRKWFKIDDFSDGSFISNPTWTNRTQTATLTDDSQTDFEAGTVKTNLDTTVNPGSIKRKWFLIDDFSDGDYISNPAWTVERNYVQSGSTFTAPNQWTISSGQLISTKAGYIEAIHIASDKVSGEWEFKFKYIGGYTDWSCHFMANKLSSTGIVPPIQDLSRGYAVGITNLGGGLGFNLNIYRDDETSATTLARISIGSLIGIGSLVIGTYYTIRITMTSNNNIKVFVNDILQIQAFDSNYLTSLYFGFTHYAGIDGYQVYFKEIYCTHNTDDSPGSYSGSQTVFESRIFDMSTDITSLQTFSADTSIPAGCSLAFFTATSADGISFDPYVAVANGGIIASTVRRYIKYKILFTCPIDSGVNNANILTPSVNSVTMTYTTIGWQAVSNAIRYQPKTNNVRAGIDIPFTNTFGTWRCNVTMTPGSLGGCKFRLYIKSTGWDIPTQTYLSGYYGEVDQAAGVLAIYKINNTGSRSLLASTAQAVNSSAHSVRVLLDSSGNLKLYWDEVLKVSTSDTGLTSNTSLSFEVDPNGDQNGAVLVDDIYFAGSQEGTTAITDVQAVFESDVIDMTAAISSLGIFQAGYVTPTGTSIAFYTATSTDGVTFDAYVAATNGGAIASAVKRYIKWKAVLTALEDNGTLGTSITPTISDVTLNWITGGGTAKFPSSVSYVFKDVDLILSLSQEMSDTLGGDSAILNDVIVQAKPLILSGADTDTQWQGTTQTPPVPVSASAAISVTNGQILTYQCIVPSGMDTSRMSGASPLAAAITFAGGAAGTWVFTRIHPTLPILKITITVSGTITDLRLIGKSFSNSTTGQQQASQDATSIKLYGDRQLSIGNQYIISNALAASIATKLVANYKDPTSYIPGITVRPTFSAQIGDRVTIVEDNTKISADYVIAGLQHQVASDVQAAQSQTDLLLLKVT